MHKLQVNVYGIIMTNPVYSKPFNKTKNSSFVNFNDVLFQIL